jgi:site-specific DNA-cytosine methylase
MTRLLLIIHSQGHSGANRHKNPLDSRNDEVAVTLSEVDRLRPDIFILENVRGFKNDRADGSFTDQADFSNFAGMTVSMLLRSG